MLERLLDEGDRVKRRGGNVPVGTEVHLVVAVGGVGKSLCPQWLDSLDRPRAIAVGQHVNHVKVDDRRRLEPRRAHDEDGPLVEGVAELRLCKPGRVGEHHGCRLVRRAQRKVEALEARAEVFVRAHEHDRHAERRLLKEGRGRGGKQEVHVVLGPVEEDLPHALGQLVGSDVALQVARHDRRAREHHVVDRRCAQVVGRARALHVLRARDARVGHLGRALLAVHGAEDAHAAHAALARRQHVARVAVVHPAVGDGVGHRSSIVRTHEHRQRINGSQRERVR